MRDRYWTLCTHAAGLLALPLLLLLSIETIARLSPIQMIEWVSLPGTANPLRFSYLWLIVALALLFAISNRLRLAACLLACVTVLIAILHAGKEIILQQPLIPSDLPLMVMAYDVWSADYFPFSWRQVAWFVTGAACFTIYCRYFLPDWRLQRRQRLLILLASGLGITYFTTNVDILSAREVAGTDRLTVLWKADNNLTGSNRPQPQTHNPDYSHSFTTASLGLIPALLLNFNNNLHGSKEPFAQPDEDQVRQIWARCMPPDKPPRPVSTNPAPPHVVVVLSESFWDPTWLADVTIDPDPLPNFRAMSTDPGGCAITTVSPIFGGYTCNAEFEVLTGISITTMDPNAVPHRQSFRGQVPALPVVFKQHGYRTVAIHPFLPDFWNRDIIYPLIGFDQFIHLDNIRHRQVKGKFIGDDAVADEAIKILDASEQPVFLFIVTMQNHSPYGDHRYGTVETEAVRVLSDRLSPDAVRDYVHGVRDADAMLRKLADYLAASADRALLVFVGDHQPNLTPKAAVPDHYTQVIRDDAILVEPRGIADKFLGPGLFWASRAPAPVPPSTTPLSLAALPSWILREAGLPLPPTFKLSAKVFAAWPALSRTWSLTPEGFLRPLKELSQDRLLQDYRHVCRDIVLGANHSAEVFQSFKSEP